jgi:hypothetical protein
MLRLWRWGRLQTSANNSKFVPSTGRSTLQRIFNAFTPYTSHSVLLTPQSTLLFTSTDEGVQIDWQWPLTGVHSIMMVNSSQPGESGGCIPSPFTLSTILSEAVVYAPTERADHRPNNYKDNKPNQILNLQNCFTSPWGLRQMNTCRQVPLRVNFLEKLIFRVGVYISHLTSFLFSILHQEMMYQYMRRRFV